ncbi:phosphonoacetaldehyde reductase [Odoribacter sp. OttesenSCG-928-J03]|nr:phosphonoacetaldehyde reductase [Odoribacter sp. OttesenSCG-928-J03]
MTDQLYFIGESADFLETIIENYHPRTIFLVRGGLSYEKSGAKGVLDPFFQKHHIRLVEFADFSVNPKWEDVARGLSVLKKERADIILAVGGGSVLDVAKLIRFFYAFGMSIEQTNRKQVNELIPLVAMPTTAGSGSEATHFAVLYKENQKYSVAHPVIRPDIAIIDPSYTYGLSPYLTACTGFDALAQAIEAYWNVNATEESDSYAAYAIPILSANLPLLLETEDAALRQKIAKASYFAGRAINITKTTAPHAFSYPFTTYYNYPHGHAVALTFPFFMEYNNMEEEEQLSSRLTFGIYKTKMDNLLRWLNIPDRSDIKRAMVNYINSLGLSFILPKDFDQNLILKNVNAERLANNPRVMKEEDIEKVIIFLNRGHE